MQMIHTKILSELQDSLSTSSLHRNVCSFFSSAYVLNVLRYLYLSYMVSPFHPTHGRHDERLAAAAAQFQAEHLNLAETMQNYAKSKGHCSYVRDICRKGMYATVWEPPGISSHIGFESNDICTHPADLMNVGSIAFSLFLLRNGITQMSAKMGSCIKGYENLKGSLLPTLITTAIKIGSKSTFKVSKIIRWRVLHGQSFTTSWNQDLKVWANSPFAFKLPNLKSRNKCIPWSGSLEYPW